MWCIVYSHVTWTYQFDWYLIHLFYFPAGFGVPVNWWCSWFHRHFIVSREGLIIWHSPCTQLTSFKYMMHFLKLETGFSLCISVYPDLTCFLISCLLQGIVTAPILYAMEEFPELRSVVDRGLDNPANVDLVSFCHYE